MDFNALNKSHLQQIFIILATFLLGLVASLIFKDWVNHITFIADIYMGLLQMAIIPFIFFGILKAFAGKREGSPKQKTLRTYFLYWGITALVITVVSTLLAFLLIRWQSGLTVGESVAGNNFSTQETIIGLFPKNIIQTLSINNILTIIILGVIMGLAIPGLKTEMREKIVSVCDVFIEWMQKVIAVLIRLLPLFIFVSSATLFQRMDTQNAWALLSTLITIVIGILVAYLVIYPIILRISGRSPLYFYRVMLAPFLAAFTSCSSVATFPLMLQVVKDEYKVEDTTVNMLSGITLTLKHAECLLLPIFSIFAVKFYGIPPTISLICLLIGISFISSITTVGVPGGLLIVLVLVFNILGFPLEVVGIISGIYVLADMPATMMNVTDDAVGLLVAGGRSRKQNSSDIEIEEEGDIQAESEEELTAV
jgi:Na+/H+-dicarboxylate symporter